MASEAVQRKAPWWRNQQRRQEVANAYLFLLPYILQTLIFTVGVILFALFISFTDYDLFTAPRWANLDNYIKAVTSSDFQHSLVNVFWYVITVVPIQTALAILLAVLLSNIKVVRQFFRTVFYAPSVTSSVVISMIFWWLYLKTGYLNLFFSKLLGTLWIQVDWLKDARGLFQLIFQALGSNIPSRLWYLRGPSVAWTAIMFQNIFTTAPTFMIMFLAALQDIPRSLYEAASLDGATGWKQFWKITLPLLRPVMLLVVVLGTIGTWQIFDQVKILTSGGPLGTTLVPVYLIYTEGLGTQGPPRMGFASAMAFILAVIIFIFTLIQRRFIERGTEMYY